MTAPALRTLRALLVDDSDASRAELGAILSSAPGLRVVGIARDGEEALREALRLLPDVIVLDLQMPRMDGFTFLRLLMARRPTPVVVVSALSRRADVFKALELGALDFVAKPDDAGLDAVREELLEKCATVRALRIENLHGVDAPGRGGPELPGDAPRVALVGASTGGPQALLQLLGALPGDLPLGVLVAQHMPAQFTAAFAQRLGRAARFAVQEAGDGDLIAAGRVLVAPGGRHLEVRCDEDGLLRAAVLPRDAAGPPSRYCPSVDRLFRSGAAALGPRAAAVVLTGMGQDGSEGVVAVKRAGGLTLVEAAETAVVDGMPAAAGRTGAVDEELSLPALADRLVRFARAGGRG